MANAERNIKKRKPYTITTETPNDVAEPLAEYISQSVAIPEALYLYDKPDGHYMLAKAARVGVPIEWATAIADRRHTSREALAALIEVSPKTLTNYIREGRRLSPQKSEIVLKYNQVVALGEELFGTPDSFQRWLEKPSTGLDGDTPMSFLTTSEGMNQIMDELMRIAHGDLA
jgi:putative toxin-antitoxin system antitoxin component (TIGR02293 family)